LIRIPILVLFVILIAIGISSTYAVEVKITASDAAVTPTGKNDEFGPASISGNTAVVGARFGEITIFDTGVAYIFEDSGGNNWAEVKKIFALDLAVDDEFGGAVAISGDTVVVGSVRDDTIGSAYIFDRNQGGADQWDQVAKLTPSDGVSGALFGKTVAIDGDTVIVGADFNSGSSTGVAYIFERNQGGANNWGEVQKLKASDGTPGDGFAFDANSVTISGDTAIVGARFAEITIFDNGAAYIFERNQGGANNWGELKKITSSDISDAHSFGTSAAIDGDTAIVGDGGFGLSTEFAYIFERNQGGANNWGEVKKITASVVTVDSAYGDVVSISGNTAIVGAWDDALEGSVFVYGRDEGGVNNWGEITKITRTVGSGDVYAQVLSISGNTMIVGARLNDDVQANAGAAYIYFDFLGGGCTIQTALNVDTIISSSCTITSTVIAGGSVTVQSPAVVTVTSTGTLDINFATKNLTVESGSGVLIEAGGKIT